MSESHPGWEHQQPQYSYGQPAPYAPQQPAWGSPYSAYSSFPQGPLKRPGTVTAASVITIVVSALVLAFAGVLTLYLVSAQGSAVDDFRNGYGETSLNDDNLVTMMVVLVSVLAVWSIVAILLAVFTLRGSNGARITLVVSSAVTILFSLLGIASLFSAVSLVAAIVVIVLLFTGGANDWYRSRKGSQPAPAGYPPPTA